MPGFAIARGPAAGPLARVELPAGAPSVTAGSSFGLALAPEGDSAVIVVYDQSAFTIRLGELAFDADGSVRWLGYATTSAPVGATSAPTQRPGRHLVTYINGGLSELVEDAPGSWSELGAPYVLPGFSGLGRPYLSYDGLRLVYAATAPDGSGRLVQGLFSASRVTIDDRFGTPTSLAGSPFVTDPFLGSDCGLLYFSGVGEILFLRQTSN
jgi:hypothetical protein